MATLPHSAPSVSSQAHFRTPSSILHPSPFNYSYQPSTQLQSQGGGLAPVGGYFPPQREVDPFYATPLPYGPSAQGSSKKRAAGKKLEGKAPSFLTKLFMILDTPEYSHMIRWDDSGSAIVIAQPELLAQNVLYRVYKQSRFASFSRQLNIYGFMRKVGLKGDRGSSESDMSIWTHTKLHRGSTREDVLGFKRRVPPRLPQSKLAKPTVDSAASPPSMSDGLTSPEPFGKLLGDDEDATPTTSLLVNVPLPLALPAPATFPDAVPTVVNPAQWQPGRRFSDQLPPSAFTQQAQSFEPRSAPASTMYPTAFRSRHSLDYTSTHSFASPDSNIYTPPTPLGDIPQLSSTHMFRAPTFSLNDASSWYACGVAELSQPAVVSPLQPAFIPIEQPFDSTQEIFAMSPDGFQTHAPLAMSDGENCSPRGLSRSNGFTQVASQRRREKQPHQSTQPYPSVRAPRPPSQWPITRSKPPSTLLFTTDPLITPADGLRANSGAIFMGASDSAADSLGLDVMAAMSQNQQTGRYLGFAPPSRPASAFGVASY